jgi:acetyl-CoA acetyltransferase
MTSRPIAAIAGIGWTDYSRNSGMSVEALALQACRRAAEDAGVALSDVDGLTSFNLGDSVTTSVVATGLGLRQLNHFADFSAGGFMACGVVLEAALAVQAGLADVVIAYRALNGVTGQRYGGAEFSQLLARHGVHSDAEQQFLDTSGITMPAQHFALLCRMHMNRYGTTEQDLAAVALTMRAHANANPRAQMRDRPLTPEDYYRSAWVAEPFRLLDCCLQTDGGCALVITSVERARDLRKPPVHILSGFTAAGPANRGAMWSNYSPDPTVTYAEHHADRLFARAGVDRTDLDFAEIYDCFTYSVLGQMEGFGLVPKGEAGAFFREGHGRIGGSLPINTHGGLLSEGYIHGLNSVVEAVSQLRGEAGSRQVSNAHLGLVTAGGATSTGSALILSGARS